MAPLVHLLQLFDRHMSIYLRSGNTRMPQHFLNLAQACSVFQHQGRRTVPPKVAGARFIYAGAVDVFATESTQLTGSKRSPFHGQE